MNPFKIQEGGIILLRGLGLVGVSAATITGIGAILEIASSGEVGCKPVFRINEQTKPALVSVGARCGVQNQNLVGFDFTTGLGIDEYGSISFPATPSIDIKIVGRR